MNCRVELSFPATYELIPCLTYDALGYSCESVESKEEVEKKISLYKLCDHYASALIAMRAITIKYFLFENPEKIPSYHEKILGCPKGMLGRCFLESSVPVEKVKIERDISIPFNKKTCPTANAAQIEKARSIWKSVYDQCEVPLTSIVVNKRE